MNQSEVEEFRRAAEMCLSGAFRRPRAWYCEAILLLVEDRQRLEDEMRRYLAAAVDSAN